QYKRQPSTNLTPADSIFRSTLDNTTIARTPDATSTSISISIKRSKLHSCTLTNSSTRRCTLSNTTLLNVPAARSLDASDSSLSNIRRVRRSEIRHSAVSDSAVRRSTVVDSTVKQGCLLRRSKLDHVTACKSRLKRAVLRDCEASECVIIGTEFTGMRLRFGVWKNGRLVGRIGEGEVVAEEIGEGKKGKDAVPGDAKVERLDYKILQEESESEDESSVSDEEAERPPPYAP
ncbi:uncharacterized protein CDV56_105732, partial [Aspergillus thermomutatus]